MMKHLDDVSTLHLLIEHLYRGKAGFVEEVQHLEPFVVEEIARILTRRHGVDYGDNTEEWIRWFLRTPGQASQSDKNTLAHIVKSKNETDRFVSRIEPDDC